MKATKKKAPSLSVFDVSLWRETEVQTWPGLFRCFRIGERWFAELADELWIRSNIILCGTAPAEPWLSRRVRLAAKWLSFGDRSMFPAALGDLFKGLRDAKSRDERERKAKEAKAVLCAIVDGMAGLTQKTPRKTPSNKTPSNVVMADHDKPVPVAYLAIEHARQLVELHQRLPFKAEVRLSIEEAYPQLVGFTDQAWTNYFEDAGLKSLEDAPPFHNPKGIVQRRKQCRAKRNRTEIV